MQRFIGEGGRKRVYLARDGRLDRDVAVAVIKGEGLDAEGLARVSRESQAMGRLGDHPNVVTVYDSGNDGSQHYIMQEYMAGGSLEDLLARADNHRLPIDHALTIAGQICGALEHAHQRGIIHRDLKPGNIWFAQDGTAKLGDFGLVIAVDRSRLTQEGMMIGTASYMPPEQALGGEVTTRSDLYALGCALYEMVAGRPPFLGDDSVAVISQHINTAPVAPTWHNPEVPGALDALITRLVAKAPEERPESATAVAEELRRIREHPAEVASPEGEGAALRGLGWGQFVGRRQEMEQLTGALENALSGHGALVMLVGEPGIGKTRLAEQFGVYARLRGTQVLTGRCYEGEAALPYRPFVEAFRQYVRDRPTADLRGELSDGAPEVAKLVSEVRRRFPDMPEAPSLEPDAERLRLFESVSAFVCNAARANPLVIFLDDIHWADKPTLLMLRYLARATAGERVLIVCAYRDVELDRAHPLAETIATLRREQPYLRILLRGLPEDDVLALLATVEPSEDQTARRQALAGALYQETEGNPFFIREVLSHLVEEGKLYREEGRWTSSVTNVSDLGIPEGIREVVGRRLSQLSEACNRVLTLASTMTGGFSWDELKAISAEQEATLLDLLDEAIVHQLIDERKGDRQGTYDFTHALIRQTLYGELSTPRRVVLHRQIGEALEELHREQLEPHLSQLAHHFYQAAPGGDVDKAIHYARRAGDDAVERLAFEEAAGQYELALQALELKGDVDERLRYELLMAAGTAGARADLLERSLPAMEQAMDVAERLGEARLLGQAAMDFAFAVFRGPLGVGAFVPKVERVLEALGDEESSLRATLLAMLSWGLSDLRVQERRALSPMAAHEERLALAQQAKAMAERVADPMAQTQSLNALLQLFRGPEHVERKLAITNDWVDVAVRSGDPVRQVVPRVYRFSGLVALGRMEEAYAEIDLLADLAEQVRQPFYTGMNHCCSAMRALLEGRYDDAERSLFQYVPTAQRTQHIGWLGAVTTQLYAIRRAQGRVGELEQAILQRTEAEGAFGANELTWAALAILYLETGRSEEARAWFERVADNAFEGGSEDYWDLWLSTVSLSATLAHRLGDEARASMLYEMLLPYAHLATTTGPAWVSTGSTSRELGMLAHTIGRWDDAERHFEHALAFDQQIGSPPWLAATRFAYAEMLHARGRPGDVERARALANQALTTFEQLGMPTDVERALALKLELQGVASTSPMTSIDAVEAAVLNEQPDLRAHAAPDGTVTILFSDIERHTAINERPGDQRWMDVLREHNAIVREHVRSYEGFEVKTEGDGFMVAFSSARKAVQCAIAIQRALAKRNSAADEPVFVRMGLHTGEPLKEGDDFYGTQVTQAARIGKLADGGEILVSALLKELTDAGGDLSFGEARDVELKDLGTRRVFAVTWQQD